MHEERDVVNALVRSDLPSFIHKVFNTINPNSEFASNWHIDLIAEYLCALERGEIKRLIINMPPRSLKSLCVSVAWPAWLLGHNPKVRIMVASYSQILSTKLSLDTRFVMNSDWYKNLFTQTKLHSKQNQKTKFLTTKYGFRFATSVGGSATGEGGDVLIVDDPHNPTHITSEKARNKVINWYSETFSTRLNNRKDGKIIIVMQRLHEEDLTGVLTSHKKDEWEVLKIPTLASEDIEYKIGNFYYNLAAGSTIHETLFSEKIVEDLIKEVGENNFQAQYQQAPLKNSGGILNMDFLLFYKELPANFDYYIQSWDTAIKISEDSDFSACTTWGIAGDLYYLVSCICHKYEYPHLKKQVKSLAQQYLPAKILIEDKASGQSLIQDLKLEGMKNIVPCKPILDKITRFATCVDLFEQGRVMIPYTGFQARMVQQQLLEFPHVKHDDIVDSVSQFLGYMKNNSKLRSVPSIRSI